MTEVVLAMLLHTSQVSQVRQVVEQYDALRVARLTCQFQLKDKIIPAECYVALRLERKLGLIDARKERGLEAQLDKVCRTLAQSALSADEPELPRPTPKLSAKCSQDLKKVTAVIAYRSEEVWSGF